MTLTLVPVSSWTFTTLPSILRFLHHLLVSTQLPEVMHPIKNSSSLHSSKQFTPFLSGKMVQLVTFWTFLFNELGICLCHVDNHICHNLFKTCFKVVFFVSLSSPYLCLDFLVCNRAWNISFVREMSVAFSRVIVWAFLLLKNSSHSQLGLGPFHQGQHNHNL